MIIIRFRVGNVYNFWRCGTFYLHDCHLLRIIVSFFSFFCHYLTIIVPTIFFLEVTLSLPNDANKLKVKVWKFTFHGISNEEVCGMMSMIIIKTQLKTNNKNKL